MRQKILLASVGLLLAACQSKPGDVAPATTATAADATASLGLVGDAADVTRTTAGGTVLMGGGPDVDAAMQWMIGKAGGGDFVVLRSHRHRRLQRLRVRPGRGQLMRNAAH